MSPEKILIVEDESIVAMEIENRLLQLGYVLAGRVDRGEDVLAAVASARPDLVLMDIMLSGNMDGIEAAESVHARFDIPVVYLTAYADDATLDRAKRTSPYGYIIKPFQETDLKTTIEIALYKHAMEKKLRQSEQRLRTLSEATFEGICITDGEVIVDANDQLGTMLGYEREELIGRSAMDIVAPGSRPEVRARMEANATERYRPYALRKDGSLLPVEVQACLMERDGKTVRVSAIQDISGRIRSEEALNTAVARAEEEKQKSEAIIAAMGDGISIQDRDFRVLYQNQVHRNMIGDHVGEYCYKAYEKQDGVCQGCPVALSFGDGKVHTEERRVEREGQALHVEITASPVFDESGGIVAGIEIARNITGRKAMEERLRKSEERHRLVLENVHEIIYVIALDGDPMAGRVEFVGGRVEQLVGYRSEEFQQNPGLWSALIHPEDLPAVFSSTQQILEQRQPGARSYRLRPKGSKEYLWFEDTIVPRIEAGRVTGYVGVARDVTKQRQADELIRQQYETQTVLNELLQFTLSELSLTEILQRALERILSIVWLSFESRGAIFLAENDRELVISAQKNMGEQERRTCGRIPFGRCLCGRAAAAREIVFADGIDERHDILHEGGRQHGHYCVPILHGSAMLGVINIYLREGYRQNETDVRFLQSVSRTLAMIIHRMNMEEERARMHRELEELFGLVAHAQKEWQQTFDSITDMISIHDEDHTIVRVNKAFSRHFKVRPQDVIGKKCYEVFHGDSKSAVHCPHQVSLKEGRPATEELIERGSDAVLLISTFPFIFPKTHKRGIIHIVRDVTAEREKEMRLIVTERLASLGQMASGIAHEINNPLAAIAGCAEGLANRVTQQRYEEAFFLNYLNIIQEEIMRCKRITSSMLSMVRQSSYDWKEVDVHETLNKTIEIIGFQGRLRAIDVVRDFAQDLPAVFGSEGEIRQVFLAIITNAFDAMEDSGVLTLQTEATQAAVIVRISDRGPGVPEDSMYKIFEPFFTTKADKGGTGLGLSIARKIMTNHHGALDVASEPGNGTTVTLSLPKRPPTETLPGANA